MYQADVALGIIDSGLLAFGPPPFTDDRFKKDSSAPSTQEADDPDNDNDGLRNEYYGPNAAYRRGWPIPPAGSEDADHGTIVAGISLGGPAFVAASDPALSSLKLRVASAVQVSSPFASPIKLSISEASLGVAFADFAQQQVTIVNASFRFRTKLTAIEEALTNNRQLLLVAAAGNDYKAYSSDVWPAAYGGALGDFKPCRVENLIWIGRNVF